MDPIIRAAPVSEVAFELRRKSARATPAAAPAPAPIAAPAPAPAPLPVPAAAVSMPAPPPPSDAQRQEAARLAVQAELEDLRADAERRGYAAGHELGEADARRQLHSQVERFQGLAAQMVQAKAGVLEDAEDSVVELAFTALCRILGEQAATREGVRAMVAQCAIDARQREQVGVRLHPDDFSLIGADAGQQLRCSPDAGVVLGGCIVDSSTGSLDARLETQLARLADTLLAVRAARRAPQESL